MLSTKHTIESPWAQRKPLELSWAIWLNSGHLMYWYTIDAFHTSVGALSIPDATKRGED